MDLADIEGTIRGTSHNLEVVAPPEKRRGRPEGAISQRAREFSGVLEKEKCDPAVITARFALGKVVCHNCQGKKQLRYRRTRDGKLVFDPDKTAPRTTGLLDCLHCKGSGKEPLVPQIQLNAAIALLPFRFPRLKHMEHVSTNFKLTGSMTVSELAEFLSRVPEEGGALAPLPPQLPEGDEP